MKAILLTTCWRLSTSALVLLLGASLATAQAPEGPQGGQKQQGPPRQQQQTPAPQQQKPEDSGASISVEVPVVTLDVIATTQRGDLLTGLKKENFRVIDNGTPQTITSFGATDAPITMVVLLEFSNVANGWFSAYAKYWADALFPNLQQKDWVALVTFDMRPRLEADFTQNKDEVRNAIYRLYFPGFSESNVFDAILDTVDRLKDVKGKKSILVLASGIDTFSKHTLDQTMKQLRQSDVTIFCVGVAKPIVNAFARGDSSMSVLQAENQLKTFAQLTGGYAWFPQFTGEIPGILHDVTAFLRNQYSLSYTPSAGANDGKFHKVKVELVQADGSPLVVEDQKHKKHKVVVYAREGYTAVKNGVGD